MHVIVESNWIVDYAAPAHRAVPAAAALVAQAASGSIRLHIPRICLSEAKRVIRYKCQPRHEANAFRWYIRKLREEGQLDPTEADRLFSLTSGYETFINREFSGADGKIDALIGAPGVEVFASGERILALDVDLRDDDVVVAPFDRSVLAAVLGRTDEIRERQGVRYVRFCVKDQGLQPWTKRKEWKAGLLSLYDEHHVWVEGDFVLGEEPPADWPETAAV